MSAIYEKDGNIVSLFRINESVTRLCIKNECSTGDSLLYELGLVNAVPEDPDSPVLHSFNEGQIDFEDEYLPGIGIDIRNPHLISVMKSPSEKFMGFGFQRKTGNANGKTLEFKRQYRWNEATVPFFMSSDGYGIFSANTYDHFFDFTGGSKYTIHVSGGNMDLYLIRGPLLKDILISYTELTGRPVMIPAWAFGLCYAARLFEDRHGLVAIAKRFRQEGIPCDMVGLEPGWEKFYYKMKWVWNERLFPDPAGMIEILHDMGFAFELWDSGDAPARGCTDEGIRRKWFDKRIDSSISIGVDFFKQDDPYPRCITSEEMVQNPDEIISTEDYDKVNIANTLYSQTVFDETRRLTGKRTLMIFHSYASSFSSHRYPVVWAGDFRLGNGAVNASLSGHAMVTQDMRSELPSGIHFGFLMPFAFMDSWAYYLEPWLFSDHINNMVRFYSRFRASLFPYLYTTFRTSHDTGVPMLRPMILEFQNDENTYGIDTQFMTGDSLLVGICGERGCRIYLPEGSWIDYWTGAETISKGEYFDSGWPYFAGGPLYVRKGSIIPRCPAPDAVSMFKRDFYIIEFYPEGHSSYSLYEDDGISYEYEKGRFSRILIECTESEGSTQIRIANPKGSYDGIPEDRKYILKVWSLSIPDSVSCAGYSLHEADSLKSLLETPSGGWFRDNQNSFIYIKPQEGWEARGMEDTFSFYGMNAEGRAIGNHPMDVMIRYGRKAPNTAPVIQDAAEDPAHMQFLVTVNPPFRVRLNHGDNWLPYYIYVGFEITDGKERVKGANQIVRMDILTSEGREMTFETNAFMGSGHFNRIDLAPAGTRVSARIRITGEGIMPFETEYSPPLS